MERFSSPELPERLRPNAAQEEALTWLCRRYNVEFSPDDYLVYSPEASMMAGYAVGWVGGEEQADKTIYVGVDTEGRINS